jgi:hypothetical protein
VAFHAPLVTLYVHQGVVGGQIPRIGWQIDPISHSAIQDYCLGIDDFFSPG